MDMPSIVLGAARGVMSEHDVAMTGADRLDDDERAHALALRSDVARARFVARRTRLRDELASRTGTRHEEIRYRREPCAACGEAHGRPRALGYEGYFSTSSTPHVVALAFADVPVGIDVEHLAPASTVADVAPLLHPRERALIDAASAGSVDAGRRAFARIWTRKEALLKATGEGLSAPLDRDDASDPRARPVPKWLIVDLADDDLDGFDGPPTFGAWAMRSG